MRYALLIIAVLAAGVAFGLYTLAAAGTPELPAIAQLVILNAKALGVIGALTAFALYSRGDYLRSAWGWLAVGSALLVEGDVISATLSSAFPPSTVVLVRGAVLAVSNVATPLAMALFARALSRAGLDLVGSAVGRWLFTAAVAVISVFAVGGSILTAGRGVAAGDYSHIVGLISGLGDVATLVLVAPLIHNVVALRGGTLAWPFMLLAARSCSWLLYDAIPGVAAMDATGAALRNCTRLWGVLFLFAAGLAQRWAMTAKREPVAVAARQAA